MSEMTQQKEDSPQIQQIWNRALRAMRHCEKAKTYKGRLNRFINVNSLLVDYCSLTNMDYTTALYNLTTQIINEREV